MTRPKRQKRGVERTKLLMCEGITDKRFADWLKRLLSGRDGRGWLAGSGSVLQRLGQPLPTDKPQLAGKLG